MRLCMRACTNARAHMRGHVRMRLHIRADEVTPLWVVPIVVTASLAVALIIGAIEPWIVRRCGPMLSCCRPCGSASLELSDEEIALTQPGADSAEMLELEGIEMA